RAVGSAVGDRGGEGVARDAEERGDPAPVFGDQRCSAMIPVRAPRNLVDVLRDRPLRAIIAPFARLPGRASFSRTNSLTSFARCGLCLSAGVSAIRKAAVLPISEASLASKSARRGSGCIAAA